MALTPSNMMPLGTVAPSFTLPDTISGKMLSLAQIKGERGTLIVFSCNHCPYVLHLIEELVALVTTSKEKKIATALINANDTVAYPADNPDNMRIFARKYKFSFPYLFDATQQTAKNYDAACTPDLFLFDEHLKCQYRGRFDDSTPTNNKPITGADLKKAVDYMLSKKHMSFTQYPAMGCSLKWKPQ